MGSDSPERLPDAVLFACNRNRVRSPIAEALLKQLLGDRIYVDSCGLRLPAEGLDDLDVDPMALEVMGEINCDLSTHRAKTFAEVGDSSFDLIISFTPEAQHRAVEMTRGRSTEIEYWPVFDPTLTEGSREARLAAYRDVRDTLTARIARRFGS